MRWSVTVAGADAPVLTDVQVVTLADGRLGFVAHSDWTDGADAAAWTDQTTRLTLTADGRTTGGSAELVRSGPAYEETRGRLRAQAGLLHQWRLRRDTTVVVVSPDPPGR